MLQDLKTAKKVVGAKQFRKALENGSVLHVFLALNADPAVTDPIRLACERARIPITEVPTMSELGRACGIQVGAAVAAILR